MIRQILKDSFKLLSGAGSDVTLHAWFKSLEDERLKAELGSANAKIEALVEKVHKLETTAVVDESSRFRLDVLGARCSESAGKTLHETEVLNKVDLNKLGASTDIKHHAKNLVD